MSVIDEVRDAVIAIPSGFVASYADIASATGTATELLNNEGTPMLGARADMTRARNDREGDDE